MPAYLNLNGTSGISAFEMDEKSINVHFNNGAAYHYNNMVPGGAYVERMKSLARQGFGLNTFINRFVKEKYAARLH